MFVKINTVTIQCSHYYSCSNKFRIMILNRIFEVFALLIDTRDLQVEAAFLITSITNVNIPIKCYIRLLFFLMKQTE